MAEAPARAAAGPRAGAREPRGPCAVLGAEARAAVARRREGRQLRAAQRCTQAVEAVHLVHLAVPRAVQPRLRTRRASEPRPFCGGAAGTKGACGSPRQAPGRVRARARTAQDSLSRV